MNLCNDGHDEVCYEGRSCPACEIKTQLEAANSEIDSLNSTIARKEQEIQELDQRLAEPRT